MFQLLLNSVCAVSRLSLLVLCPSQCIDCRVHKRLERDTTRKITWTKKRNISDHIMSSATKIEGGMVREVRYFLLRNWLGICLPWEVVSDHLCITITYFVLLSFCLFFTCHSLIVKFISSPTIFFSFFFLLFFLSSFSVALKLERGRERAVGWYLDAYQAQPTTGIS